MTYHFPTTDMEIPPEDRRRVRIGRGMGTTVSRLVGITGARMVVVLLDAGLRVQAMESELVYDDIAMPPPPQFSEPQLVCVDGVRVRPRVMADTWGGTGGAA